MTRDPLRRLRRLAAIVGAVVAVMMAAPVTVAQSSGEGKASPPTRPVRYRIAAGDFDGDGRSEVVTWDSRSRAIVILRFRDGAPVRLEGRRFEHFPTAFAAADLDGDGCDELVVGEGLEGYNRPGRPPVDVSVRIYRPLRKDGWTPEEVYRKASERPAVTALAALDSTGDRTPELLFSCFVSKYVTEIRQAKREGDGWAVRRLAEVRMGMHVTATRAADGNATVLVARPYGDRLGDLGGAFELTAAGRVALPAFRGASSVAAGDVDGDGDLEILVGDGWHQNYGRIARARLTVMRRQGSRWDASLIEDLPEHMRIVQIVARDLDGDGRAEVIARGERPRALGGDVRLYRYTAGGWQGRTLVERVQGFALGRFLESGGLQMVAAGPDPTPLALALGPEGWDAHLAEAVETRETRPEDLLGRPAPPLEIEAWIGPGAPPETKGGGKVLLLDFWATWCKPCIAAFPTLRRWRERYGPEGLLIVGITHHDGQTGEQIRRFVEEHRLPWPVGVDPRKRPQVAYAVGAIPHLVLVDRKGIVRLSHLGAGRLDEVERAIERCLAAGR